LHQASLLNETAPGAEVCHTITHNMSSRSALTARVQTVEPQLHGPQMHRSNVN
jgi:hypothetical protein